MSSSSHRNEASDKNGMSFTEKVRFAVLLVATGFQLVYLAVAVHTTSADTASQPILPPNLTDTEWQGLGWAVIALTTIGILLCIRRRWALAAIALACAAFGLLFGNLLGYPEKHSWLAIGGFALFAIFWPSIRSAHGSAKERANDWRERKTAPRGHAH